MMLKTKCLDLRFAQIKAMNIQVNEWKTFYRYSSFNDMYMDIYLI